MTEIKMTEDHKKFILEKLCPFILREQGRGFAMDWWKEAVDPVYYIHPDLDQIVDSPSCGTVCCIGGSIQFLLGYDKANYGMMAEKIGLTVGQADILFDNDICWPEPYLSKWNRANTPLEKAEVAVELLKEVARTGGQCLGEGHLEETER